MALTLRLSLGQNRCARELASQRAPSFLRRRPTWRWRYCLFSYLGYSWCDRTTARRYEIERFANLEAQLLIPLIIGKVHGSLARAGKVKHQTPKVEKQEKKKKKTGRAKRRVQYNRRFVNVVQTFGRKKGPNANAA